MDEALAMSWRNGAARPDLPIVLPSGFGAPLMTLQAATTPDMFAMSLLKGDPTRAGLGLFLTRFNSGRRRVLSARGQATAHGAALAHPQ